MKKIITSLLICMSVSAYALQVSDSLYISSSDNVANLILSEADYATWIDNDGFSTTKMPQTIAKKLYSYFKDDFDVIMFISNESTLPFTISYYGINMPIANSVQGIGEYIYDNSAAFGSAGKLFSVMHLPYRNAIRFGPSLHEFCHCWANSAIPTAIGGHWGFCGGNTPGQLGGFKQSTLQTNVDGIANKYTVESFGLNANGGNSVPYNELELYLMGMLPVESVQEFDAFPDVDYMNGAGCYDTECNRIYFISNQRTHYTPASLITLLGQRVPDYSTSQKEFKALFVVLSKAQLTSDEWQSCVSGVEWFCMKEDDKSSLYNFWEATRGVGSINPSELSLSLKSTVGIHTVDADMTIDVRVLPSTIICSDEFRIYDLSGRDVTTSNGSLPYGIYIVHTANGVKKVSVK